MNIHDVAKLESKVERTAENAARLLEIVKSITKRDCGTCSMCCKVLKIAPEPGAWDEPEKPAGKWCWHCKPGKGCSIYPERPPLCRAFGCLWLIDAYVSDFWKPNECKMVLHVSKNDSGDIILSCHVDTQYRNRWREEPYYSDLKHRSFLGLKRTPKFFVKVMLAGGDEYLILPNKDILNPGPGIIVPMGNDEWDFARCENVDQADAVADWMEKFQLAIQRDPQLRAEAEQWCVDNGYIQP